IAILLSRAGHYTRMIGRAARDGFYIYGNVPTAEIEESAREGLERLRQGEAHLAVSPLCGTNLAVAGVLAGLSSLLALGPGGRLARLPNVMTAAMLAVLVAQPLGRLVQKHLTTSPDLSDTEIVGVHRVGKGLVPLHKVRTACGQ
ncbi:MAG: DUF6391 domain-containing protein, partial [Dehalococcoidia bacterium]